MLGPWPGFLGVPRLRLTIFGSTRGSRRRLPLASRGFAIFFCDAVGAKPALSLSKFRDHGLRSLLDWGGRSPQRSVSRRPDRTAHIVSLPPGEPMPPDPIG